MDAAGPEQAHKVQSVPFRSCLDSFQKRWVAIERPIRDCGIDPRQILDDGFPGAKIEVADLAIAHLPGRQPNGPSGRLES